MGGGEGGNCTLYLTYVPQSNKILSEMGSSLRLTADNTSVCQELPIATIHPLPGAIHPLPGDIHPLPGAIHPLPRTIHLLSRAVHLLQGAIHPLPGAIHPLPKTIHLLSGAVHLLPRTIHLLPGAIQLLPGAIQLLPGAIQLLPGTIQLLLRTIYLLLGTHCLWELLKEPALDFKVLLKVLIGQEEREVQLARKNSPLHCVLRSNKHMLEAAHRSQGMV